MKPYPTYLIATWGLVLSSTIFLSKYYSTELFLLASIGSGFALSYSLWHLYQKKYSLPSVYTLTVFIFSCALFSYQHQLNKQQYLTEVLSQDISIKGEITDIEHYEHLKNSYRIRLLLQSLKTPNTNAWTSCSTAIWIYTKKIGDFSIGDWITLNNTHITFPKDSDFALYCLKEGISGSIFLPTTQSLKLDQRPARCFGRTLEHTRKKLFCSLRKKLSEHCFSLYSALFLGNRNYNKSDTEPLYTMFKNWGIAHVYARSGIHLVFFALALNTGLLFLPFHWTTNKIIILIISSIYYLLSWQSTAFNRAFYTLFLAYTCTVSRKQHVALRITLIIYCVTLILNPFQLFFLDFQLSFFLTLSLATLQLV